MCPKDVNDLSKMSWRMPDGSPGYLENALGGLGHFILIPMTRPNGVVDELKGTLGSPELSFCSQGDAFRFPIDQSGRQAKVLKHHFRVLGILAPSKRQTRFIAMGSVFVGSAIT